MQSRARRRFDALPAARADSQIGLMQHDRAIPLFYNVYGILRRSGY
jgi:hypothetical protein